MSKHSPEVPDFEPSAEPGISQTRSAPTDLSERGPERVERYPLLDAENYEMGTMEVVLQNVSDPRFTEVKSVRLIHALDENCHVELLGRFLVGGRLLLCPELKPLGVHMPGELNAGHVILRKLENMYDLIVLFHELGHNDQLRDLARLRRFYTLVDSGIPILPLPTYDDFDSIGRAIPEAEDLLKTDPHVQEFKSLCCTRHNLHRISQGKLPFFSRAKAKLASADRRIAQLRNHPSVRRFMALPTIFLEKDASSKALGYLQNLQSSGFGFINAPVLEDPQKPGSYLTPGGMLGGSLSDVRRFLKVT